MSCRGSIPAKGVRPEGGYALLLAVFIAATMFLAASIAVPSIVNQGRREREQQLIWRGNQYARGIRLYFQKNGRFPQNKDELIKGTLSVHFLRKAFTDPVASSGDDWRLIYVNPSGQLIGSVRYHTLQEMAAALGANAQNTGNLAALLGGAPAAAQTPAPGAAGAQGAAGRGGGAAGPAGARGGPGALAAGAGAGQTQGAAGATTGLGQQPTPVPLQAVDGPVFGASMIGIASKVKQDSLLVYQGKENYFEWEFIWNPLLNPGGAPRPQQTGVGVGAPGAAQPGGTGIGTGNINIPPLGSPGGTMPATIPPPMGQPPAGAGRGPGRF